MYEPLIDSIADKKVAWCQTPGNQGDQLIERVTRRMLENNASSFATYSSDANEFHYSATEVLEAKPEIVLWSGNGSFGSGLYPFIHRKFLKVCRQAGKAGTEVVVGPCSATSAFEIPDNATVFAREQTTAEMFGSEIVPDLALDYKHYPAAFAADPIYDTGLFLREDKEAKDKHPDNVGDPVALAESLDHYIRIAAQFKHIITNRLHFAITGLRMNREVTLLPGSWHKNRSVYEQSLSELGCNWSEHIPAHTNELDTEDAMDSPFDYFDRIYVLNLDEDTEMMESFWEEARQVGIADRVQRFSAIERPNGFQGNAESHLAMLREAYTDGVERVLILEDDCDFVAGAERQMERAVQDLRGRDWAMFYLGIGWGPHDRFTPEPVGDYLFRLHRGWFIHAYAVNLQHPGLMRHIENTREGAIERHDAWDNYYSKEVFDEFPCYSAQDLLAFQKKRVSRTAQSRRNFVPQNIRFFEQHKRKALSQKDSA